jgi:hypothetical protein
MSTPKALLRALDVRDGRACAWHWVGDNNSNVCSIQLERPQTECGNTRRGLTHPNHLTDWRATVNGTRICIIDGCESRHYSKGYCVKHYQRVRTHGDPYKEPTRLPVTPCIIDGCEKPALTLNRTLCTTHYSRHKKGMDLHAPVRLVRPARGKCQIDGCTRGDCGPSGYCLMHKLRIERNGDPHTFIHQRDRDNKWDKHVRWTGDEASYSAVHLRLRATRGSAKGYECVDCGGRAKQWSYDHADPAGKVTESGIPYSANLDHYFARCVPCHKRFDLARIR